jgi:hypothetical protein
MEIGKEEQREQSKAYLHSDPKLFYIFLFLRET